MKLRKWEDLPEKMKNDQVKPYYDHLRSKQGSLVVKRLLDVFLAVLLFVLVSPVFLCLAIGIKFDSKGPVLFRQARVTQYGKVFHVFKFRTMVHQPTATGALVTAQYDTRITKVGGLLRKIRLDELPQLLNIIKGEMSFVGTRPEVERYVAAYSDEMMATLLLPAGVTSKASIYYKDEDELLAKADDIDAQYMEQILPAKMQYNLKSLKTFTLLKEWKTMGETILAVMRN